MNKREEASSKHADFFFFSFSNISQEKLEPELTYLFES